jgi:glycosyltransferase involved in cell wall biosynthesis
MESLNSKKLLVIAPHCQVFIKDQLTLLCQNFKRSTIILPHPYTTALALRMPFINRRYSFLRLNVNSFDTQLHNCSIFPSPFFTLPIEILRRRNPYIASKSCEHTISKQKINFNLIHAHFLENGFIGAQLKAKFGVPLIVTAHGVDVYDLPFRNDLYNLLIRYVINKADYIITVSQSNKDKLLSLGAKPKKVRLIPNGYNESLFSVSSSIEARKRLGLPLNMKVLLSVGNLVTVKGHKYLIDAMNIISKKRNDVILILIGSGSSEASLRQKTKELNLEERIFFFGAQKHEEIPKWMNACDLFVLPSLMESFGVVSIEAMACGKPVIGTRVGGIPEIVRTNDVGILTKPADPKELSEVILVALNNRGLQP